MQHIRFCLNILETQLKFMSQLSYITIINLIITLRQTRDVLLTTKATQFPMFELRYIVDQF